MSSDESTSLESVVVIDDTLKNAKVFKTRICNFPKRTGSVHTLYLTAGSGKWEVRFRQVQSWLLEITCIVDRNESAEPRKVYEAEVLIKFLHSSREQAFDSIRSCEKFRSDELSFYKLVCHNQVVEGSGLEIEFQVIVKTITDRFGQQRIPNIHDPTENSFVCVDKDGDKLYIDEQIVFQLFATQSSVMAEIVEKGSPSDLFEAYSYGTIECFLFLLHGVRLEPRELLLYNTAKLAARLNATSVLRYCENLLLQNNKIEEETEEISKNDELIRFDVALHCGFRRYVKMVIEKR